MIISLLLPLLLFMGASILVLLLFGKSGWRILAAIGLLAIAYALVCKFFSKTGQILFAFFVVGCALAWHWKENRKNR